MKRRQLLHFAAAAIATSQAGHAFAQAWPARPVTLVVPYAPGGNADATARMFAEALSRTTGQTVLVENRAGGGGAVGAMHVAGSRPDGYTLLFSTPGVFSVTPHIVKVNYGPSSVRPLCLVTKVPLVLVVKKGSRFKTLADVVNAARPKAETVAMGHSGLGTPNHLALLDLEMVANVRFNAVAYKGSAPMLQDILAGQVELGADQYSSSRPFIEAGDLVPIAVFGAPLDVLPNVPAVSTLGKEPMDVTTYLGIVGPAKMPDDVATAFQKAAQKALADPQFVAAITKQGSTVHWGPAQAYEKTISTEYDFMKQMVAMGRVRAE